MADRDGNHPLGDKYKISILVPQIAKRNLTQ